MEAGGSGNNSCLGFGCWVSLVTIGVPSVSFAVYRYDARNDILNDTLRRVRLAHAPQVSKHFIVYCVQGI